MLNSSTCLIQTSVHTDFSPSSSLTHTCPPASYQMAISTPVAAFVLCPLFWTWPVSALCSLSWFPAALHQLLIHQHPLKALSFFTLSLFILPCFSTSSLPHQQYPFTHLFIISITSFPPPVQNSTVHQLLSQDQLQHRPTQISKISTVHADIHLVMWQLRIHCHHRKY